MVDTVRTRLLAVDPWWLLTLPLYVYFFTMAQAVVSRVLGVPVWRINLGAGPVVVERGGIRVGLLPIGASVQFGPPDDEAETYHKLSVAQKVVLQLSGPAALALLAPPLTHLHADLAVLALAVAAVNLLPYPGSSGGQALVALWTHGTGRQPTGPFVAGWALLGLVGGATATWWLFFGAG